MCLVFEFDAESFESCKAPWLSSKTGKHGIRLPGIMKRQTCLTNNNSFTVLPRATYSASEVEGVAHFCVLDNQHTHALPHIIAPSDTNLLSVALLGVVCVGKKTFKKIPESQLPMHRVSPVYMRGLLDIGYTAWCGDIRCMRGRQVRQVFRGAVLTNNLVGGFTSRQH